jgi:copper homeostasis protein
VTVLVEACVDSLDAARAAGRAGATRLELCANLAVGGTTPSAELVRSVCAAVGIPVFAMVRPRGGGFVYDEAEIAAMLADINRVRDAGAHGVVIGALTQGGTVDMRAVRVLLQASRLLPVTFHKAFDAIADQAAALERLVDAGVQRILTSGGERTALEGSARIGDLIRQANDRIVIMPGGGVRASNLKAIVRATGAGEVHARCGADGATIAELIQVAKSGM